MTDAAYSPIDDVAFRASQYTLFEWTARQAGLEVKTIESGDGLYFVDTAGRRYLDFSSQYMNLLLGHRPQRVVDAVHAQLETLPYIMGAFAHSARAELGRRLADITPVGLTKSFHTIGGAEAIECAVKIARTYTGRQKIVSRYRSFHGATYAASSLSGDPRRLPHEGAFSDRVVRVEDPYCYRCPWGRELRTCARECADHVEQVIALEGPETIAAVLLEGATAGAGCHTYPPEYWPRMRALCDRHGILLISDEVVSFVRTGTWLATDRYGIAPDIVVLAKGLSAGIVPFGAVVVSDAVSEYFDDRAFDIGLTGNSHPLGCAAAVAVFDDIVENARLNHVAELAPAVEQLTRELFERHPSVGDIRFTGLLGCIELVKDRHSKAPLCATANEGRNMVQGVRAVLDRLGVFTLLRPGFVFFAPPITAQLGDLKVGFSAIDEALRVTDALID